MALDALASWTEGRGSELVQLAIPGVHRVVADFGDAESCELIVALGGDGTTLAALHAAAGAGRPVMGVACGSVGALTATRGDVLDDALDAFDAGEWQARLLPAIAVTPEGGERCVALNDF